MGKKKRKNTPCESKGEKNCTHRHRHIDYVYTLHTNNKKSSGRM